MTRFTLLILLMISLLAGSCSENKNISDDAKQIPEKDFIAILSDVYLADGLLSNQSIKEKYAAYDSIATYIHIIENHGYTKASMDKTMEYYFIKKPQKMIEIYDKVLAGLSQRESIVEKELLRTTVQRKNLWTGKDFYFFPGTSDSDSSEFNTTLSRSGIYTLNFSATVFPDDQSVNPGFSGFLCNPDSISTGRKTYIESINYIKDGQQHDYSIVIKVPENITFYFSGFFYGICNNPKDCEKHAQFDNIALYFL